MTTDKWKNLFAISDRFEILFISPFFREKRNFDFDSEQRIRHVKWFRFVSISKWKFGASDVYSVHVRCTDRFHMQTTPSVIGADIICIQFVNVYCKTNTQMDACVLDEKRRCCSFVQHAFA